MDIKILSKEEISLEEVLANKLVIKCETRDEAYRITNMGHDMGLVWTNGERMLYNHYWDVHKQDTCYDLSLGACDRLSRYVAQDRVIIDSTRVKQLRIGPTNPNATEPKTTLEAVIANKLAVNCQTPDEAIRILNDAIYLGVKLNFETLIEAIYWQFKEETCYALFEGSIGSLGEYREAGYSIIDSTEIGTILTVGEKLPKPTPVGGDHYQDMVIQPIEFILKNNLNFAQGNVIKYICRYKHKNGLEDLLKAREYIDYLIKEEYPD